MNLERQVSWWSAIRNLPHSPLLHYLSTAHQRRQARASGVRRNLLFWLALFYVVPALILGFDAVVLDGFPAKNVIWISVSVGACLGLIYYLIALARTMYITFLQAVRFLAGDASQAQTDIRLDDQIALLPISSREILVALLARFWPPLIMLSLGAGLLMVALAAFAFSFGGVINISSFNLEADVSNQMFLRLLTWAPVTIGSVTLGGSSGSLILILWSVTMGRGTTNRLLQSLFAGAVVLVNTVINPLTAYFALLHFRFANGGSYQAPSWVQPDPNIFSALLVIALVWLVLIILLSVANSGKQVLAGWFFSPIVVVALVVLVPPALDILIGFTIPIPSQLCMMPRAFNLSPTAILASNPLSLPNMDLLGFDILAWSLPYRMYQQGGLASCSSVYYYPLEWFRFPLLLLQQLGMVLIGMFFAVRAIEKRRRGFE